MFYSWEQLGASCDEVKVDFRSPEQVLMKSVIPLLSLHLSMYHIPYTCTRKFCWISTSLSPSYLCTAEKVCRKKFRQCGKGHHILYAIFNTGQELAC